MEEDLKIFRVEYLSYQLLDHGQILKFKSRISATSLIGSYSTLNLSLYEQTIFYKFIEWRGLPKDEKLKILKVKYLRNHLLDNYQILIQWKTTLGDKMISKHVESDLWVKI